jgi:2-keto-3-deoxy-galactonokinase
MVHDDLMRGDEARTLGARRADRLRRAARHMVWDT